MNQSFEAKPRVCFEVEKVIGVSTDGNVRSYRVQWAPAWVSSFHLVGCENLIQEFLQQQSEKENKRQFAVNESLTAPKETDSQNQCAANSYGIKPSESVSNSANGQPSQRMKPDNDITFCNATTTVQNSYTESPSLPTSGLGWPVAESNDNTGPSSLDHDKESELSSFNSNIIEIEEDKKLSDNVLDIRKETKFNSASIHPSFPQSYRRLQVGNLSGGSMIDQISSNLWLKKQDCGGLTDKICLDDSLSSIEDNADISGTMFNFNESSSSAERPPFFDGHNFVNEMPVHSEEAGSSRTYICSICGKHFLFESALATHIREHAKRYACPECGKTFSKSSHVSRHMRIHTGERPFICEVCGKNFSRNSHLKRHLLTHKAPQPHVCDICGEMFEQYYRLWEHLQTHVT